MKIESVVNDGYRYTIPEDWGDNQMVGYMPALLAAGEAFVALEKALAAIPDAGVSKFHTGVGVSQIILDIEGDPYGTIMYLDDVVQFVPFNQQGRTEESQ